MKRSATDFFPPVISTLMNLETSWLAYFGSGRTSRFGISLRRGVISPVLRGFSALSAVFRTALFPVFHACSVETAAHHVVAHAGQVLDPAAADQHDRVLLKVVAFAADIADNLEAVRQPHLGDFPKRRVRLLRSRRIDACADPAALGGARQRGYLALRFGSPAGLTHELVNRRHKSFC